MNKLFGTDGIRGHAGKFPLDDETVRMIGASLTQHFRERTGRDPRFVTGRDTRESGPAIEAAFHDGAHAEGAVCESASVITTPGVAYLAKVFDFDAGVVISASHNPYQDNGIKIFLASGKKTDEEIESQVDEDVAAKIAVANDGGQVDVQRAGEFCDSYLAHLKENVKDFLASGIKVVIDCANGAASDLAPKLFSNIGAEVIAIHNTSNGRNINENCGSLHLEHLQAKVVETKAQFGVAFDGDADRALFVDEKGNIVDGDATLWIMAQYLRSHDKLKNSKVVATVMSNVGLELALKSKGIELLRANVGDKYVLDELIKTGSEIGGEQSGHIIFPEVSLVGDGMMTALLLLRAVCERGVTLSEATAGFVRYPQILKNVKVREKRAFGDVPQIADAAMALEKDLDGNGRLLLRYSGTENLARVMIEGKDQKAIEAQADRLAGVIAEALG